MFKKLYTSNSRKGFAIIQVVIAAAIFSLLALAMSNLIIDQKKSIVYLEDQLERVQLIRNLELILADINSCQNTLQGLLITSDPSIPVSALKDNRGNDLYQSSSVNGMLRIGQIHLSNSSLTTASTYGFIDINIPIERVRSGGGPKQLKTYVTKLGIEVSAITRRVISCSIPEPHFLGGGTLQMNGSGNVICKPLSFAAGYTEDQVVLIGNNYYKSGDVGAWTNWTVYFKDINYNNGTGQVCIDSGGWSGAVNSEYVKWMAFRKL